MDEPWWDAEESDIDIFDEGEYELEILEEEQRRVHYLDGVPITGREYPLCLEKDRFDCERCSFFPEDECRLRKSKYLREDIWEIIQPWVAIEKRKEALRKAVEDELRTHGRPLHYTVLARIVQERYPRLKATEKAIMRILTSFSDIFEQVHPGVYQVFSSRKARQN